jgi:hypothetical protein
VAHCLSLLCIFAALTVRYLTRRFIGEYRSNTGKNTVHFHTCKGTFKAPPPQTNISNNTKHNAVDSSITSLKLTALSNIINKPCQMVMRNQDSSVGIAAGYRQDSRGVAVSVLVGTRFFSSPSHPGRFWGPTSLLSNGYHGFFPRGKVTEA